MLCLTKLMRSVTTQIDTNCPILTLGLAILVMI
jgi:hypothetical protein